MDLKTKGVFDNTVSLSVTVFTTKGISPFLHGMSVGVNRYLMDNDLSLAYVAINVEKKSEGKIVFVFKESMFDHNQEVHIEFVKKFMEELWNKNIRTVFHENVIEKDFESFKMLKDVKASYDNNDNNDNQETKKLKM